jgi:hypothetical protein
MGIPWLPVLSVRKIKRAPVHRRGGLDVALLDDCLELRPNNLQPGGHGEGCSL